MSSAMSSAECPNCLKSNQVIGQQKSQINLIEVRIRDLVKAYKKVCLERDNLLAISSTAVLPSNDCQQLQKRLSTLEASVANMSVICGDYESQRVKDKQLIQELTLKCELLTRDVEQSGSSKCEDKSESAKEANESVRKFRHRAAQTEESIDWTNEEQTDDNEKRPSVDSKDAETQTDFQTDFDVFGAINRKKTEFAIVLPTLSERKREITSESESNSDQISIRSRGSTPSIDSNVDNYPVFASDDKQTNQTADTSYPTPTSSGVSLFYANELARKEIDLAETRLQARENECALRELNWKYNTDKYRLQSRINELERNLSQISCTQPMSSLTITYVRNVLLKLLTTKDKQQKQFMINAILTALEPKQQNKH